MVPEGPARYLDASRQKLTPHCLAAIFDSQLPSPKLSLKMPPELPLPHNRGHLFLFQNCPRGEGNCAAIERQKLSRGNFCLAASRCLSGPSGVKNGQNRLEIGSCMGVAQLNVSGRVGEGVCGWKSGHKVGGQRQLVQGKGLFSAPLVLCSSGGHFWLYLGRCWSPTPSRQPLFETSDEMCAILFEIITFLIRKPLNHVTAIAVNS